MINLYSTNCPKCKVLEKKLQLKNIDFKLIEGAEEIAKLGFDSAPILEVDDKCMEFKEAVDWVNER